MVPTLTRFGWNLPQATTVGSGSTPEIRAERMKQSRSILDSVVGELESLRRQLGAGDVRTVNQYTDEIREIERRIQLAAQHSNEVPDLDLPPGIPEHAPAPSKSGPSWKLRACRRRPCPL